MEEVDEPAAVALPTRRKPPTVKLHPQIAMYSSLFPITDEPSPPDMNAFLHELPSFQRAEQLLDNYHKYYSWKCARLCSFKIFI